MYIAWTHTDEQRKVLQDRHQRLQRNQELDDAWKTVGSELIQAFYQIFRYPGDNIVLSHIEKTGVTKTIGTECDERYERYQYLGVIDASIPHQDDGPNSFLAMGQFCRVPEDAPLNPCPRLLGNELAQQHSAIQSAGHLLSVSPPVPVDPDTRLIFNFVTRFPVELQLKILEALPLHRGDLEVRLNYPHLIPLWIETIPARFNRYATQLCSVHNMHYVGRFYMFADFQTEMSGHYSNGIEFYRLKSLDYHSEEISRLRSYLVSRYNASTCACPSPQVPIVDLSTLKGPSETLLENLKRLFYSERDNNLRRGESSIAGDRFGDDLFPFSGSIVHWTEIRDTRTFFCPGCDLLPARPFMIPLSFGAPLLEHESKEVPDQYLLIFEDELAEIFKNMEIAWRPIFWLEDPSIHLGRDRQAEREFAEWMECGCITTRQGYLDHW